MDRHSMRGFSLIETMIVCVLIFIVSAIAVISLKPGLQAAHVANGYNTTVAALRQARDFAVAQRQVYLVTFSNASVPNTITITQNGNGHVVATYPLPLDVVFTAIAGIPTAATKVPDGFGTGGAAIDFDQGQATPQQTKIYFQPDGTAQDSTGNINNGVVYIAMPGQLYSSRAITLWGATGRIRGWRLVGTASLYWRQT
ncbi:MAG TPA: prepilin-type N-terminal cleavage/methylation domain-containing protein [Terriglobales bacterium]|nr:prepilin-type N-terminal cleavage/methylation domain-containing protein [Terriglobales bacterium]